MRTLTLFAILLVGASTADAADIQSSDVRLRIKDDGSARATVSVILDAASAGEVAIPVGFAGLRDLQLTDAPPGTTLSASPVNGQTTVRAVLPAGVPSTTTVSFSFSIAAAFQDMTPGPGERSTLPADSRLFRHALINTDAAPIGIYRLEVTFPAGTRAQAVREWTPKLRKGEVGPRVRLAELADGPGARLQVSRLKQGDSTSMLIELVPAGRSRGWLIVGLVLSALYLVYFKDLVGARAK